MIVVKEDLIEKFLILNEFYFQGELPMPSSLEIIHSYKKVGEFEYTCDENENIISTIIRISDNFDYSKEQFVDTLLHEMIHYYLALKGEDKDCTHGKKFKEIANDFNIRYGTSITKTININELKVKKGKSRLFYKFSLLF